MPRTRPPRRKPLPPPKSATELLDLLYLELRCHLLETAAGFDRIARARGAAAAMKDPRLVRLRRSLRLLAAPGTDRAERFLRLFSD